jgi:hypothetical protein
VRLSSAAGDTGDADPAVRAVLAAYAAGEATEHAMLTVLAASRLLVPVVAVLAEANSDGSEKETEMALPTLVGNDGRTAVIAFTSTATLSGWRADARPVPVPARRLWAAARSEADAVVIDVAGPVPVVIEGARLRALAQDGTPPPAHADPDIRAAIAEVLPEFTLEPGAPGIDLVIAFRAASPAQAQAVAGELSRRLHPRLRRFQLRPTG